MGGNSERVWSRFPNLYIVERFLSVLWESGKEFRRTELHMAVGLNYRRCKVYLELLQRAGLIAVRADEKGRDIIRVTESGVRLHNFLSECLRLFKSAQQSQRGR